MSETSRTPSVAERTMADLISSEALSPNIVAYGLSQGRYWHNQGFGAHEPADKVVHGLVEQAVITQLERGGGDLLSLAIGTLAGYRQAQQQSGGEL